MFNEFKKFILRGNVVDLAVGIVIGAAFTSIVNSLVNGIITPLISLFYDGTAIKELAFTINGTRFLYGEVIANAITFLIVATVIFFFVVKPINKLSTLSFGSKNTEEAETRKCPFCLGVIPAQASKCMHCGSKVEDESAKSKVA